MQNNEIKPNDKQDLKENSTNSNESRHTTKKQSLLAVIITTAIVTTLVVAAIYQAVDNYRNDNYTMMNPRLTDQNMMGDIKQKSSSKLETYTLKGNNNNTVNIKYPEGWKLTNNNGEILIQSPDGQNKFSFPVKELQNGNYSVKSSSSMNATTSVNGKVSTYSEGFSVKTSQNGNETTIEISDKPDQNMMQNMMMPFNDQFFQDLDRINHEYDELFSRIRNF